MMRRLAARLLAVVSAAALVTGAGLGLAACKQEEGEYCQVDEDCKSGLKCNLATDRCQREGTGTIDAGEVDAAVDAFEGDAREDGERRDAAIDAATDAPVDAAPDA